MARLLTWFESMNPMGTSPVCLELSISWPFSASWQTVCFKDTRQRGWNRKLVANFSPEKKNQKRLSGWTAQEHRELCSSLLHDDLSVILENRIGFLGDAGENLDYFLECKGRKNSCQILQELEILFNVSICEGTDVGIESALRLANMYPHQWRCACVCLLMRELNADIHEKPLCTC